MLLAGKLTSVKPCGKAMRYTASSADVLISVCFSISMLLLKEAGIGAGFGLLEDQSLLRVALREPILLLLNLIAQPTSRSSSARLRAIPQR